MQLLLIRLEGGGMAPEGLDLALGEHLDQLEHGAHVLAQVGEVSVVEAVR